MPARYEMAQAERFSRGDGVSITVGFLEGIFGRFSADVCIDHCRKYKASTSWEFALAQGGDM